MSDPLMVACLEVASRHMPTARVNAVRDAAISLFASLQTVRPTSHRNYSEGEDEPSSDCGERAASSTNEPQTSLIGRTFVHGEQTDE